eukprot:3820914-Pyramimonas_sp.AAC.1
MYECRPCKQPVQDKGHLTKKTHINKVWRWCEQNNIVIDEGSQRPNPAYRWDEFTPPTDDDQGQPGGDPWLARAGAHMAHPQDQGPGGGPSDAKGTSKGQATNGGGSLQPQWNWQNSSDPKGKGKSASDPKGKGKTDPKGKGKNNATGMGPGGSGGNGASGNYPMGVSSNSYEDNLAAVYEEIFKVRGELSGVAATSAAIAATSAALTESINKVKSDVKEATDAQVADKLRTEAQINTLQSQVKEVTDGLHNAKMNMAEMACRHSEAIEAVKKVIGTESTMKKSILELTDQQSRLQEDMQTAREAIKTMQTALVDDQATKKLESALKTSNDAISALQSDQSKL